MTADARKLRTEESRTPKFDAKVAESEGSVKAKEAELADVEEGLKAAAQEAGALEQGHAHAKAAAVQAKLSLKRAEVS